MSNQCSHSTRGLARRTTDTHSQPPIESPCCSVAGYVGACVQRRRLSLRVVQEDERSLLSFPLDQVGGRSFRVPAVLVICTEQSHSDHRFRERSDAAVDLRTRLKTVIPFVSLDELVKSTCVFMWT